MESLTFTICFCFFRVAKKGHVSSRENPLLDSSNSRNPPEGKSTLSHQLHKPIWHPYLQYMYLLWWFVHAYCFEQCQP